MRSLHLVSAICLLAALFTPFLPAQAIVTQQWDYRISGINHGIYPSCGLGVDGAGNSYICGSIWRSETNSHALYLNKFSPAGDTLWTSLYGSPNQDNVPTDMVVDAAGNLYVTGARQINAANYDLHTLKYNTAGQLLWEASYIGPGEEDRAAALAVDDNGNVYVTGRIGNVNLNYDYVTLKYNPQGQQLWAAVYSSSSTSGDEAVDVAVDAGGNVYVTGLSSTRDWPNVNYNIVTLKYNALGQQQWVTSYDGPAQDYDAPVALKLDAAANLYVTGSSTGSSNNTDIVTLKYNSAGTLQWVERLNYLLHPEESGRDLALDSDGSVIVSAYSIGAGIVLIKYNAGGVQQWLECPGLYIDYFYQSKIGIVLDASHNLYVAGREGSTWYSTVGATYKYDALGNWQWTARYNPDACEEEGANIAIAPNGDVFVAGDYYWPDYGEVHPYLVKYNQSAGDFSAVMIPTISPIQIPAQGGSFSYDLETFNTVQNNLATDFWWKLIYPAPSTTTISLGPIMMSLPLDSASVLRTQRVPGSLPTGIYHYVLYAGDYPNMIWASDTLIVVKTITGDGPMVEGWDNSAEISDGNGENLPASCLLNPCNPNPFNATTALSFKLQAPSSVSLKVYDTAGRLVTTLVEGWREAGTHAVTFNGSNLASGIYLAKLEVGKYTMMQKLVLLK
jgi:uncharacterized delta-60 repeat protein